MSKIPTNVKLYILIVLLCLIVIVSSRAYFGGIRSGADGTLSEDKIVIYTSRTDNLLDATIPLFEEKYEIQVELVRDEIGRLLSRIREGDVAPADVIMGGTFSYMYSNRDLFLSIYAISKRFMCHEPLALLWGGGINTKSGVYAYFC